MWGRCACDSGCRVGPLQTRRHTRTLLVVHYVRPCRHDACGLSPGWCPRTGRTVLGAAWIHVWGRGAWAGRIGCGRSTPGLAAARAAAADSSGSQPAARGAQSGSRRAGCSTGRCGAPMPRPPRRRPARSPSPGASRASKTLRARAHLRLSRRSTTIRPCGSLSSSLYEQPSPIPLPWRPSDLPAPRALGIRPLTQLCALTLI